MDIMTKTEAVNFLRRLKNYEEKKNKNLIVDDTNLYIVEPKCFDMLLRQVKSDKLLELHRVSNSCSQICKKSNIEYQGLKPSKVISEWDGDIVIGYFDADKSILYMRQALGLLQEGRFFAMCQRLSFLNSTSRYQKIFKEHPFDTMYMMEVRPYVSKTGKFNKAEDVTYHEHLVWYVWRGGSKATQSTIQWLEDIPEYYLYSDGGSKIKEKLEGSNKDMYVYKKPINVRVDHY